MRVVEQGRIHFGVFDQPFAQVNLLDAELGWPRPFKWWRLKEWQTAQIITEDLFMNVALYNSKSLALAQIKFYDRKTQQFKLWEPKTHPWSFELADQLLDSENSWHGVRYRNCLKEGWIELQFNNNKGMSGTLQATHGILQTVSLPFPERGGMVSHKGLFELNGELDILGKNIDIKKGFFLLDDHKGYYPYVMAYDWVTGAGVNPDGKRVAFNLTRNGVRDPETYNENCLWVGRKKIRLAPVSFKRHKKFWRIRDRAGLVDVRFTPEHDSRLNLNLGLVKSRYYGPLGHFSGEIHGVDITNTFGMGEDFWLRA